MFFINLLKDFYSGLSGNSFFFFWVIIFVIIVLFGLIGALIIKNNKLCKLLNEQMNKEKENYSKHNDENNIYVKNNDDIINNVNNRYVANYNNTESKDEEKDLYQKNVLRDSSKYTSPIGIVNDIVSEASKSNLRYDSLNPLEEMDDLEVPSDKIKETEQIISSMEKASTPNRVELTDYEKKEEDEAIISYNELQKVKDKIYDTEESEETDEFINELKSFNIDVKE